VTNSNNTSSIKELKKQLKKSCVENNAALTSKTLIEWAKLTYTEQTIRQLSDLKKITNHKLFINELALLQHVLYSPEHNWHGLALWQAFLTINNKKTNQQKSTDDSLPMFNY